MQTLKPHLQSIGRKLRIWEIMNEPKLYPSFGNLSAEIQATIFSLSSLNPIYFGSTILKLYGLTSSEPQDIDILIKDKETYLKYKESKLLEWVEDYSISYRNNPPTHTYKCVKTGVLVHLVLEAPKEVIYVRNMCIIPVNEAVAQVYQAAIENPSYENKHCMRLLEIDMKLDGTFEAREKYEELVYYYSAIPLK